MTSTADGEAAGRCRTSTADLLAAPDADAPRVSQCLFGERVDVLERADGWYRVRNRRDGYTGHARHEAFDDATTTEPDRPTLLVGVRATLLFARPDMKSPLRLRVPFGAELDALDAPAGDAAGRADRRAEREGEAVAFGGASAADTAASRFVRVRGPGGASGHDEAFVWHAHCLAPGGTLPGTPVDVARRLFDGTPYLWGGRTPDGADCSGLLQGAALALGLPLPRDSGEQERFLEHVVPWTARAASDAVFWPGHVGLLIDPDTLFHATAHTLSSVAEPLAAVIERAGPPSSIRRPPAFAVRAT